MHLLFAPLLGLLLFAPPPEEVKAAARRILSDSGYQKEMPGERRVPAERIPGRGRPEDRPPAPPRERETVPERTPPPPPNRREETSTDSGGGGGSEIGTALLWILIVVVAGLVLLQVAQGFRGHGRRAAGASAAGAGPAEALSAEALRAPLSLAESLARDGRFGEAIHALLLDTLGALVRHTGQPVPASLTSREILARVPMAETPRKALSGIVHVAEVCHFGGRVPAESEWHACQERFRQFVDAYGGGGA